MLTALAKVRNEEIAEADKRSRKFYEMVAEYDTLKEHMRRYRLALKKLDAAKREHFARPLFPRTDAARDAAWSAAAQARREALARGETLRIETVEQCGARQKVEEAVYTP